MRLSIDLPDEEEARRLRPVTQKHELPTKLDRAVAKKRAKQADEKALAAWALAVKARDRWKDRYTGRKLKRTRDLDPLRAEAHHLAPREDEAVRYDPRNGVCLSFATHDAVERNTLRIKGTVFFHKNGKRYIDATFPLIFEEVE